RLSLPLGFLDTAVMIERTPPSDGEELADTEPWPDPVNGAELLEELSEVVNRHLRLSLSRGADAVALWIIHAHCLCAADISPTLAITSPTIECGKTTLLDLVSELVPRQLSASNITPAATYRAIEKWHPTLLIDEADTFLRHSEELRGILNASHRRSKAFVIRT